MFAIFLFIFMEYLIHFMNEKNKGSIFLINLINIHIKLKIFYFLRNIINNIF